MTTVDLDTFEAAMKIKVDALIAELLSNEEWLEERRASYNVLLLEYRHLNTRWPKPTDNHHPYQYTDVNIESFMRFGMATKPHTVVGNDYFTTYTYDGVMRKLQDYAHSAVGSVMFKNAWGVEDTLVE